MLGDRIRLGKKPGVSDESLEAAVALRGDTIVGRGSKREDSSFITMLKPPIEPDSIEVAITFYSVLDDIIESAEPNFFPELASGAPLYLSPFWEVPLEKDGFRETPFGRINDLFYPWVYNVNLVGWLWISPDQAFAEGGGIWAFHANGIGWLFQLRENNAFVYVWDRSSWAFVAPPEGETLYLYDFSREEWFAVNG